MTTESSNGNFTKGNLDRMEAQRGLHVEKAAAGASQNVFMASVPAPTVAADLPWQAVICIGWLVGLVILTVLFQLLRSCNVAFHSDRRPPPILRTATRSRLSQDTELGSDCP